jgi:DtxR family Mn-dependent transcriptional regulator
MMTARTEDYIKEIFRIECTGCEITVTDLAKRLGIAKSTVVVTVQKLVSANLLKHERYGALHLTGDGRLKGLMAHRRHEGLRAFFHELLGVDRDRSSEMACGMEHYMNIATDERLFAMLEFFRNSRAEQAPWMDEMFAAMGNCVTTSSPLSALKTGEQGTILRLSAGEDLRGKLQALGFTTGTCVTCLNASSENSVAVLIGGRSLVMPRNESATIWLRSVVTVNASQKPKVGRVKKTMFTTLPAMIHNHNER